MEEKYIIFDVCGKKYSVLANKSEPTQINKIVKNKETKKYFLNYKSDIYEVVDLCKEETGKQLKKFDGLILVKDTKLAYKFEGFYELRNSKKNTISID